ncbi:hypothetical protein D3C71_1979500 [compost metagenome]
MRRRVAQGLGGADIDVAQGQGQVTGAVAHLVVKLQAAAGRSDDAAFGVNPGHAAARCQAASADIDCAGGA